MRNRAVRAPFDSTNPTAARVSEAGNPRGIEALETYSRIKTGIFAILTYLTAATLYSASATREWFWTVFTSV
jgi:hypothetical protein